MFFFSYLRGTRSEKVAGSVGVLIRKTRRDSRAKHGGLAGVGVLKEMVVFSPGPFVESGFSELNSPRVVCLYETGEKKGGRVCFFLLNKRQESNFLSFGLYRCPFIH